MPLEQLSDIKAASIVEWIANQRVRRTIMKGFRNFLTSYTDEQGSSVYGNRIRVLGEGTCYISSLICVSDEYLSSSSQLGIS